MDPRGLLVSSYSTQIAIPLSLILPWPILSLPTPPDRTTTAVVVGADEAEPINRGRQKRSNTLVIIRKGDKDRGVEEVEDVDTTGMLLK